MNKQLIMAMVVGLAACSGQHPPDGKAAERLVSEFNSAMAVNDSSRLLALFTKDADYAVGKSEPMAVAIAIQQLPAKRLPWDERTALTIKVNKIQFHRSNEASVDATQTDYAPMPGSLRKWTCTFLLVQIGKDWKIKSYREEFSESTTTRPEKQEPTP
ncbi:MAG: nuclear transport factor 2 family protein [Bryobacteraceae bacterium]